MSSALGSIAGAVVGGLMAPKAPKTPGLSAAQQSIQDTQARLAKELPRFINRPYMPYGGPRISPFSADQLRAMQMTRGAAQSDQAGALAATPLTLTAAGLNPMMAQQIMSPYMQGVTNEIARLGNENLLENVLPQIDDRFIQAGQARSGRNEEFTQRAIRDTQREIQGRQAQALQSGFTDVMNRALQAGAQGANLGTSSRTGLFNVGQSQQGMGQQNLDLAYQDFMRQYNYPLSNIERLLAASGSAAGSSISNPQPAQQPNRLNSIFGGAMLGQQIQGAFTPPWNPNQTAPIPAGSTVLSPQQEAAAIAGGWRKDGGAIRGYADGGSIGAFASPLAAMMMSMPGFQAKIDEQKRRAISNKIMQNGPTFVKPGTFPTPQFTLPPGPPEVMSDEMLLQGDNLEDFSPQDLTPGWTPPPPTQGTPPAPEAPKDLFERIMDRLDTPQSQFALGLMASRSDSIGGGFADAQQKLNEWRKGKQEAALTQAKIKESEAKANEGPRAVFNWPTAEGQYLAMSDGSTKFIPGTKPEKARKDLAKEGYIKLALELSKPDPLTGAMKTPQEVQAVLAQYAQSVNLVDVPQAAAPTSSGSRLKFDAQGNLIKG